MSVSECPVRPPLNPPDKYRTLSANVRLSGDGTAREIPSLESLLKPVSTPKRSQQKLAAFSVPGPDFAPPMRAAAFPLEIGGG
jgi:hypothetical protein